MTESKMENVIRLRSKEFRRDKGVKWSRINNYLPFKWIPIGYEVNNNSYAYDICQSFSRQSTIDSNKSALNNHNSAIDNQQSQMNLMKSLLTPGSGM